MDCESQFCERHSDIARALKFCYEYEVDLHTAPENQKQVCMDKLNMAIAILHQSVSNIQEKLYKKYILKDISKYEINTNDIPFTE